MNKEGERRKEGGGGKDAHTNGGTNGLYLQFVDWEQLCRITVFCSF
jgi:hypothetical protein